MPELWKCIPSEQVRHMGEKTAGVGRQSDPAPEAGWQVWYRDLFDRECPPRVEASGYGLVRGLMELWARHLFETVRPDGSEGFSRFNLWWERGQVLIEGDVQGAARVREWVFGRAPRANGGYAAAGDAWLLHQIALAHAHLVVAGGSCEEILLAAARSAGREEFQTYVAQVAAPKH